MSRFFIFLCCCCGLYGCWDIQTGQPIDAFAPGLWRGQFHLDQQSVPVLYEVHNTDNERPIAFVFRTADQQVISDTAYYFGDTLYAFFEEANTYLRATYQIDQMDGHLYDATEQRYPIRFSAIKGPKHRFPNIRETPLANLTGEWNLSAGYAQDSSATGTLRLSTQNNTATGQLRFGEGTYTVEGTIQGNKLYLSGFDGQTVVWISALVMDANHLDKGSLRLNDQTYYLRAHSAAGVEAVE